jgi:hypothetical protein
MPSLMDTDMDTEMRCMRCRPIGIRVIVEWSMHVHNLTCFSDWIDFVMKEMSTYTVPTHILFASLVDHSAILNPFIVVVWERMALLVRPSLNLAPSIL